MSKRPVDRTTEELAASAMLRLAEFETRERHAIRCVFEAALSGEAVADDYLEIARSALARRALH